MVRLVVFLFVETQENGDMVNIGRNPASTSGSVFNCKFLYMRLRRIIVNSRVLLLKQRLE